MDAAAAGPSGGGGGGGGNDDDVWTNFEYVLGPPPAPGELLAGLSPNDPAGKPYNLFVSAAVKAIDPAQNAGVTHVHVLRAFHPQYGVNEVAVAPVAAQDTDIADALLTTARDRALGFWRAACETTFVGGPMHIHHLASFAPTHVRGALHNPDAPDDGAPPPSLQQIQQHPPPAWPALDAAVQDVFRLARKGARQVEAAGLNLVRFADRPALGDHFADFEKCELHEEQPVDGMEGSSDEEDLWLDDDDDEDESDEEESDEVAESQAQVADASFFFHMNGGGQPPPPWAVHQQQQQQQAAAAAAVLPGPVQAQQAPFAFGFGSFPAAGHGGGGVGGAPPMADA